MHFSQYFLEIVVTRYVYFLMKAINDCWQHLEIDDCIFLVKMVPSSSRNDCIYECDKETYHDEFDKESS